MKRPAIFVILVFWALFAAGCGFSGAKPSTAQINTATPMAAKTMPYPEIPKQTEPIVQPRTPTSVFLTPTSTPTPIQPTATTTILSTVPVATAQAMVLELLNNTVCRLPCWWGITPGKTTWEEARAFLLPLAKDGEWRSEQILEGLNKAGFLFALPANQLSQSYSYDQDGLIQLIEIHLPLQPFYNLSTILTEYGEPEEVWIKALGLQDWGAYMLLSYPSQGFLAMYSFSVLPNRQKNVIPICFDGTQPETSRTLALWNSDNKWSVQEVSNRAASIWFDDYPRYLPLQQATGLTLEEFYQTFKDGNPGACLETPLDLWW